MQQNGSKGQKRQDIVKGDSATIDEQTNEGLEEAFSQ